MTPERTSEEFAAWVRRMRSSHGLSSEGMADRADMARTTYNKFERPGTQLPTDIRLYVQVADALGIELGYFLHKAGFDMGAATVNIQRVARVEAVVDRFSLIADTVRGAIAEAMNVLDTHLPFREVHATDHAIMELGRALGLLDAAEQRLRSDGYLDPQRGRAIQPPRTTSRPWSVEEDEFLRLNPSLSHATVADRLHRTEAAVRKRRSRFTSKTGS